MTGKSASLVMVDHPARWCVLRMAGQRTLAVRDWLARAGIAAWTPEQIVRRRRPRGTGTLQLTVPIAATFVFAPADDEGELRRLTAEQGTGCPQFHLLRHEGRLVELANRELDGLRWAEEHARPRSASGKKVRPAPLPVGAEVALDESAFTGMTGLVTSSDGRRTWLNFGGLLGRVQIDTDRLPMAA